MSFISMRENHRNVKQVADLVSRRCRHLWMHRRQSPHYRSSRAVAFAFRVNGRGLLTINYPGTKVPYGRENNS